MQATITYLLTEQAQRAAMAATGQPVARKQTMTIDVPAEDLRIFPIKDDGTISLDVSGYSIIRYGPIMRAGGWAGWNGEYGIAANIIDPPFIEDYKRGAAIVAARDREKDELTKANGAHNRAATDAAYQRFAADPAARIPRGVLRQYVGNLLNPADFWPESNLAFLNEAERRNQLDADAKTAAKIAAEADKQSYIAEWVANNGDEVLRAQFADGLADRAQIIDMIADEAFDAAGVPAEIADSKVCDVQSCPCHDKVVASLPTPIYAEWRKIKAGLPEGSSAEFSRVRDCLRHAGDGQWEDEEDSALAPYYAAEVTIPCGPFHFTRRINLG